MRPDTRLGPLIANPDGSLRKQPNGSLANECCCDDDYFNCRDCNCDTYDPLLPVDHCSNCVPETWTAIASGITHPAGPVVECNAGTTSARKTAGDINGEYCLTTAVCGVTAWKISGAYVTSAGYSDAAGTIADGGTYTETTIELGCTAGGWCLSIYQTGGGSSAWPMYIFAGTFTDPNHSANTLQFVNAFNQFYWCSTFCAGRPAFCDSACSPPTANPVIGNGGVVDVFICCR